MSSPARLPPPSSGKGASLCQLRPWPFRRLSFIIRAHGRQSARVVNGDAGRQRPLAMTAPVVKPYIDAIAPYVPGKSKTDDGRKAIKLSSNESPLGTSPKAREAYFAAVATLDRYPDAGAIKLREAIAAHYGIEADRIVHGTGSDEVLHLAAGAFAGLGDEVLYTRYGFSVYPIAARRVGSAPIEAPDSDYGTDVDVLL